MMRLSTILFFALCAVVAPTTATAQAIETAPDGYKLVWSDEFNGTALNEQAWSVEVTGSGGGNQELQYYRRENVSVADGNLVLTARRENYQGKSFTSGRINSNQKAAFKHGIMQARIKFPMTENGLWPAYWMMGNDINRYGWPRCGEIDIVEMGHFNAITGSYAGWQDRYFSGTLHYGPSASNADHQQNSQEFTRDKFESIGAVEGDYHIFTLEWDGDYLYMYYDLEGYNNARKNRARYFTLNIAASDEAYAPGKYFQKPFYFLFNLAVGGTFTNIYDPAAITALPNAGDEAKMYVDWVRVYQKEDDADAQYLYTDENGEKQTNIEEEPEPEPVPDNKTELSDFATKALDEQGQTTFDFNDVEAAVLISTSEGVTGNLYSAGATIYDYNVNNDNRNLYIWDNTYVSISRDGKDNSFGWGEGYNEFAVANVGWSGLGFNIKGEDLSMIDDTYWLHFAMKGNDQEQHASHNIYVGNAQFRVGSGSDGTLACIGDYKRDGEWYYFDIPVKALKQFATPLFDHPENADANVFCTLSGGVTDTQVCFDNIFFYKSKEKSIPTYTDNKSELGRWGYKSVDEQGQSAFDLSQVGEIIPFTLTEDLWKGVTADGYYQNEDGTPTLVARDRDYTMQGGYNNFFVWGDPQTFQSREEGETVTNSTGVYTGNITSWASTIGSGWNGMGFASIDGMGFFPKAKDLSMIDDSYYLHFALRSDAAVGHIPVTLRLGSKDDDATITLGAYSSNRPLVGDFPRNGEWYSFDIPVAELKKYGKLWSDAPNHGGIEAFTDYVLCFYTAPTYYSGSYFSFDNVFFWKKADGTTPDVAELGEYTTKSLDAEGKSYFDFDDKDFITVAVGKAEREMMGENIVGDFAVNDMTTHLYFWEGTCVAGTKSGTVENSFGIKNEFYAADEGWIDLVATDKGWMAAGLVSDDGYDVSLLDQERDDWYMHFAVRGDEQTGRDLTFVFGKAHFTIGSEMHLDNNEAHVVLGNFRRDNEWYSYDIPMTAFWAICPDLFPQNNGGAKAFADNLFVFKMPQPKQGDELQVDNLFFWRQHKVDDGVRSIGMDNSQWTSDNSVYDLSGRRVGTADSLLKPGLYIIKGKKVVIK